MPKKSSAQNTLPRRCMIEVEPQVGAEFESIRLAVGDPKKINFMTAVLKYVTARVKAGELVLVNNELKPAESVA